MPVGSGDQTGPEADTRARYDVQGGPGERAEIATELAERVDGEGRFDQYTRQLYGTDASICEVKPIGVVKPTDAEDVATVVSSCARNDIAFLPRGDDTSLPGQAANEAVVLYFKTYMDGIEAFDPDEKTGRGEPDVPLAELDGAVEFADLQYAPDPAWGDKACSVAISETTPLGRTRFATRKGTSTSNPQGSFSPRAAGVNSAG